MVLMKNHGGKIIIISTTWRGSPEDTFIGDSALPLFGHPEVKVFAFPVLFISLFCIFPNRNFRVSVCHQLQTPLIKL